MTTEQILVKACEIASNDEVAEKISNANSPEEVRDILANNGLNITLDELESIGALSDKVVRENEELSAEELDNVSGGIATGLVVIGGTLVVLGGVCVVRRAYLKLKKL